jgi:hypothetical protein
MTVIEAALNMLLVGRTLYYSGLPSAGRQRPHFGLHRCNRFPGYQGIMTRCVALIAFNRAVSRLGSGRGNRDYRLSSRGRRLGRGSESHEIPPLFECAAIGVVVGGALLAAKPLRQGKSNAWI